MTAPAGIRARFYSDNPQGAFTNLHISTREAPNRTVICINAATPGIAIELTADHALQLMDRLTDLLDELDT